MIIKERRKRKKTKMQAFMFYNSLLMRGNHGCIPCLLNVHCLQDLPFTQMLLTAHHSSWVSFNVMSLLPNMCHNSVTHILLLYCMFMLLHPLLSCLYNRCRIVFQAFFTMIFLQEDGLLVFSFIPSFCSFYRPIPTCTNFTEIFYH